MSTKRTVTTELAMAKEHAKQAKASKETTTTVTLVVPVVEEKAEKTAPTATPAPTKGTGNVVPAEYRTTYGKAGNCGDEVAVAFKELCSKEDAVLADILSEVAENNGLDLSVWAHLNIGMQRMNLGNRLRGLQSKRDVRIGARVFKMIPKPPKAPAKAKDAPASK